MQTLTGSKFDNVIADVTNNLKIMENMKESNNQVNNSSVQNNNTQLDKEKPALKEIEEFEESIVLVESQVSNNKEDEKEELDKVDSLSFKKEFQVPNENGFPSKYDEIFTSNININPSVMHVNKFPEMPNKSVISKEDFMNFNFNQNHNQNQIPQKDTFITPKDWNYTNDESIFEIETKVNAFRAKINHKEINLLFKSIKKSNINVVFSNEEYSFNVAPISTIENLVESNFAYDKAYKEQISEHILSLHNYVYKWRNIFPDGNGFYRAVMYAFLENVILTDNTMAIKELICIFEDKINNENRILSPSIQKHIDQLDKNIIAQILYVIYIAMDNPLQIGNPYEILLKAFNFCVPFDKGMIFFLKFLLYEFVLENKDKLYTPDFPIKIGNLLAPQFIKENGEPDFDLYFEEELLKMDVDAQKIAVFLVPFVLRCDINIIVYDFDKGEIPYVKKFECGLQNKFQMNLLFRSINYDIIYDSEYYKKYEKTLSAYEYRNLKSRVVDMNAIEQLKNINKNNESNQIDTSNKVKNESSVNETVCKICENYIAKKNKFNLCYQCLLTEIENQTMGFYLEYLSVHTSSLNPKQFYDFHLIYNNFFNKKTCVIRDQQSYLSDAAKEIGKSLKELINEVKKKICVVCQNTIEEITPVYTLPCGCNLCDNNCFDKYFNLLLLIPLKAIKTEKKRVTVFDSCLCGFSFKNEHYINFINDFEILDKKKLKNKLKKAIINNWYQQCLSCCKQYSKNKRSHAFFDVELKDERGSPFGFSNFKHIICGQCKRNIVNKSVVCNLCNYTHQVVQTSKIELEEEDCLIF